MSKSTRDKKRRREARMDRVTTMGDPFVQILAIRTSKLPDQLRRRLLELGPDLIPRLLSLVENEQVDIMRDDDPPDAHLKEWPAAHAAMLLAEMRVPHAIEPMLGALIRTAPFAGWLHDRLLGALPRFGAALAPAGLSLLATFNDVDVTHEEAHGEGVDEEQRARAEARGALCSVLAKAGIHDDRLRAALWEHAKASPELYDEDLVAYGDKSLLPELLAEIERRLAAPLLSARHPNSERGKAVFPLAAVYQDLGGTLPPLVHQAILDLDARVGDEMTIAIAEARTVNQLFATGR